MCTPAASRNSKENLAACRECAKHATIEQVCDAVQLRLERKEKWKSSTILWTRK